MEAEEWKLKASTEQQMRAQAGEASQAVQLEKAKVIEGLEAQMMQASSSLAAEQNKVLTRTDRYAHNRAEMLLVCVNFALPASMMTNLPAT